MVDSKEKYKFDLGVKGLKGVKFEKSAYTQFQINDPTLKWQLNGEIAAK